MPNDAVFDYKNQPVFNRQINTYQSPGTVAPPDADAASSGREFMTTATNSQSLGVLGGSVVITLQLSNPNGSGRTLYLSRIAGGTGVSLSLLSSFNGTVTFVKGGTLTSPSTLTPVNGNFASATTSVMTARSSVSASSGGTPFMAMPLSPGPFEAQLTGAIVVPPNQAITVTVSAALTVLGVLSCTANMVWWEG
ncbi:hypothetical protein [Cohnella sp. GCM10027633]|uniref:hypothetical protein n=1 Tax=unclassified Cohnella TaxID=2636738 RepID=UPI003631BC07